VLSVQGAGVKLVRVALLKFLLWKKSFWCAWTQVLQEGIMVRVVIANGHFVIREGLKFILSKISDIRVVGEAATRASALQLILKQECDVLLMDLQIPGVGGEFELLKDVRQQRPRAAVLVFSALPEKYYGMRALRSGAAGYLTKDCCSEDLVRAIRKVGAGGRYVSPALAEIMVQRLGDSHMLPHESLSTRELEVFLALASGKSSSEIARAMSLSIKTISTYRARILEKMNLRSSAELMQYAIRNELIEDSLPLVSSRAA
jgi:two-component system, NarL family, invasion response regulator UvrY